MGAVLLLVAFVGHVFLWIGLINRLHSLPIPRRPLKLLTGVFFVIAALIPAVLAWSWPAGSIQLDLWGCVVGGYLTLCLAVAPITLLRVLHLRWISRSKAVVLSSQRRLVAIDLAAAAVEREENLHHPLTRLPGNETLQLEIHECELDMPRPAPTIDRLSIVHLSDFHFTGLIGKAYFREVVRVSNELQPDLLCVTGDIIDDPDCLDWIPDTLGRLSARHGVYFVLGNHDRRVDHVRLRSLLIQCDLIDLGGRWLTVDVRGTPILMAGNEGPWFSGWGKHSWLPGKNHVCLPPRDQAAGWRIVLAHTPDQFGWARANDADLLLAGHTHGGQILIPPVGAIFSPSIGGVRHVSGVYCAPPTILYVTRGLSGDAPVRWNCRPEIAHLLLRNKDRHGGQAGPLRVCEK